MTATDLGLLLFAYALGAIPFGLLFTRWRTGQDPRQYGSGNIGATNTMRTAGKAIGLATLAADIAKGALAVGLAAALSPNTSLLAFVALASCLGHVFPIYLGFKGGKGVATMLGVVLAWQPWWLLPILGLWLLLILVWRYVSVASITAAWLLPLLAWQADMSSSDLGICLSLAILLSWCHRTNIQRLLAGKEAKIGA